MEKNRPTLTENTSPLLLSLVIMTALSLIPMLSHGAVFWDDEMEEGNTDFSAAYMLSTLIPAGTMAYDTNVKFSGNGSIRLNYPPACQTLTTQNQCGGSITRKFPPSDDYYQRIYFRMSGKGPNPTSSGVFETSVSAFTKMMNGLSTTSLSTTEPNGGYARFWWTMGCCSSKNYGIGMERVPTPTSATPVRSSKTFVDNVWYCLETRQKMNDVGVANGIVTAWVDGVQVMNRTDVLWRNSGVDASAKWYLFQLFRQLGIGNIWYDRAAAGDTRIGCLGAGSASDTTQPAAPQRLVIR